MSSFLPQKIGEHQWPKHRKIRAWRDPMPKPPDYLSPHCSTGNCRWCTNRRAQAERYRIAVERAKAGPFMFWDTKTGGHQEQLGPSAPDRWLTTYVKEAVWSD